MCLCVCAVDVALGPPFICLRRQEAIVQKQLQIAKLNA